MYLNTLCSSHLSAFIRAFPTSLGASFTVFSFMFPAFFSTPVAGISAKLTDGRSESATTAHIGSANPACLCTVDASPGALLLGTEASIAAVFAFLGTFNTSFYAIAVFEVGHVNLLYHADVDLTCTRFRCHPAPRAVVLSLHRAPM